MKPGRQPLAGKLAKYATYGPPFGQCAICSKKAKLTEDHIPPRGCVRPTQVAVQNLLFQFPGALNSPGPRRSQNGVKFRSICKVCNSERLAKFDVDLARLTNAVTTHALSGLALPSTVTIDTRPIAIIKSVIGHLLAFTGEERPPKGVFDESLAAYFLGEQHTLDPRVDIFYWFFPYRDQILVRDSAFVRLLKNADRPFAFKLIKFFPLAFFVTFEKPEHVFVEGHSLEWARRLSIADEHPLGLDLRSFPPRHWPEMPANNRSDLVVYGGSPMHAKSVGRDIQLIKKR